MEEFIKSLLSLSIGGSIVAVLLILLRGSVKNRLPKSFFYYAWLLVLLRLALPIPGQMDLKMPEPPVPVTQFVETVQTGLTADLPVFEEKGTIPENDTWRLSGEIPRYTPSETPEIPQPREVRPDWALVIVLVWAAGFVWSLSRDLWGYFRFRHAIRRTMIPAKPSDLAIYCQLAGDRRPRLCRSAAVDTPMLMGLLHPTLLLPDRTYSPETLECVFLHELTHYARHDILYKWFAVPVLAMHWFNPLMAFIRRDIDRCCELSCDEKLLKEMDHDQRKAYGESLLVLAARSAPSRTVLSTTFATEKKNLKERLVHIMNFSPKSKWAILAAVILLIAVALCAVLFGPQSEPPADPVDVAAVTEPATVPVTEAVTEPAAEENPESQETTAPGEATAVVVKTVDEFLAALAPNTEITLEPGVYDLTTAKDYGQAQFSTKTEFYRWEEQFDGYQLTINDVQNLTISGTDKAECEIVTTPRYAAVLNFDSCENVRVSNITAGHTEGPGRCVGAVIRTAGCAGVNIDNNILYGCGTYGVESYLSNVVNVTNCDIKECSLGAARFNECLNVQIRDCNIFDCGLGEWSAYELFYFLESRNCAVVNCEITNSNANYLLATNSCKDIHFVSNEVSGCKFSNSVIDFSGAAPMVDASSFKGLGSVRVISTTDLLTLDQIDGKVLSLEGKELNGNQLKSMTRRDVGFTMPFYEGAEAPKMPDDAPDNDANAELEIVEVSTVDEFLAAIRPNTLVMLAPGTYDLSTASDYTTGWTDYYRWVEVHDGYELELMYLDNFHIKGSGKGSTIITAKPRYANVLVFNNCQNISVFDLTAGHTIEPGYCTGGVLAFENCVQTVIDGCGLYGCGIYGIMAYDSSDLSAIRTEIYDCSYGAVWLDNCKDMVFDLCDIHDCPLPYFTMRGGCTNITADGKTVSES